MKLSRYRNLALFFLESPAPLLQRIDLFGRKLSFAVNLLTPSRLSQSLHYFSENVAPLSDCAIRIKVLGAKLAPTTSPPLAPHFEANRNLTFLILPAIFQVTHFLSFRLPAESEPPASESSFNSLQNSYCLGVHGGRIFLSRGVFLQ